MDTIEGIKTVIAVVETGSFTAASDRLAISKSLVSKYIGEVEERLGVRLFNRTTRQIALTEAGNNYYQHALDLLEQYNVMLENVVGEQAELKGLLRLSAPFSFGEQILAPVLSEFMQRFPKLKIDLRLSNKPVDMLEEGIDLRIRIGRIEDSNMIARQLQEIPLILVASPSYIEQYGLLDNPHNLEKHDAVIDSNFGLGKHWPLYHEKQGELLVNVSSKLTVNGSKAVTELSAAGAGIGLVPRNVVEADLKSGRLIHLLPDYKSLEFGLYLIYPHRKFLPKKLKCFIEFMQQKFDHY